MKYAHARSGLHGNMMLSVVRVCVLLCLVVLVDPDYYYMHISCIFFVLVFSLQELELYFSKIYLCYVRLYEIYEILSEFYSRPSLLNVGK